MIAILLQCIKSIPLHFPEGCNNLNYNFYAQKTTVHSYDCHLILGEPIIGTDFLPVYFWLHWKSPEVLLVPKHQINHSY